MRQDNHLFALLILAIVAVAGLLLVSVSVTPITPQQSPTAAVVASAPPVFSISTSTTKGTISMKTREGKTLTFPLAADGSTAAGSVQNEPVLLSTKNNPKAEDYLYLEGETCAGTQSVTDCLHVDFLMISNKNAHIIEIGNIDTTNNQITFNDKTYGTERVFTYNDGAATTFSLGDRDITLTISETTNNIIFNSIGSSNGATIELADKATITLTNNNLATYTFDGFQFSEHNDKALADNKYITNLQIDVFYDDSGDQQMEIASNILTDLTATTGSGWVKQSVNEDNKQNYLSAKGTLFIYDQQRKNKLAITHIEQTSYAQMKIKKTSQQEKSSKWEIHKVDSEGNVGRHAAMILDKEQRPHISYTDATKPGIKYAYGGIDGWYVHRVDDGAFQPASDIAVDTAHRPHIVYVDKIKNKIKYAWLDNKVWHQAFLEGTTNGIVPTIALQDNKPHVIYYDYSTDDLEHIYFDGIEWKQETIDEQGDVGDAPAMAIKNDGSIHVVYIDNTHHQLKYAWFDGTNWKITPLDTSGRAALYTNIQFDEFGKPWIWYYDRDHNKIMSLRYLKDDLWDEQTFSLSGLKLYQGDIVIDNLGQTHFSYYDEKEQELRYAKGVWE